MSDKTTADDPVVIAWRDAFAAANGRQPDQVPSYENGWYVFCSSLGWITSRHRKADLARMTGNLIERANIRRYGNQYD